MTIDEIIAKLAQIMAELNVIEHNSATAKSATYIDYAIKELKKFEAPNVEPTPAVVDQGTEINSNDSNEDDSDQPISSDDDYVINEAGGKNPVDDKNFGLLPSR